MNQPHEINQHASPALVSQVKKANDLLAAVEAEAVKFHGTLLKDSDARDTQAAKEIEALKDKE